MTTLQKTMLAVLVMALLIKVTVLVVLVWGP